MRAAKKNNVSCASRRANPRRGEGAGEGAESGHGSGAVTFSSEPFFVAVPRRGYRGPHRCEWWRGGRRRWLVRLTRSTWQTRRGLMREREGRAEALAGTFNAQHVANNLWAASVFFVLRDPAGGSWWVHTMKRLVSPCVLGQDCVLHYRWVVLATSVLCVVQVVICRAFYFFRECCLLVLNSVTSTPQWIRQPEAAPCNHIINKKKILFPVK